MAEGDDIGAEFAADLVDSAAAKAAADVAAVFGLLGEKAERRAVDAQGPVHAAAGEVFAERLDGLQELALVDGEGTDGKVDGGAVAQQQQGFEQRERVLTAGKTHGDAIAFPDHFEPGYGFAHFTEDDFLEFQIPIIKCDPCAPYCFRDSWRGG